MAITVYNPNFESPREAALKAAAVDVAVWLAEPGQVNTETFTGADIAAGVPSVAELLPLADGEIHALAEYAGCDVRL